ncbi:hypothetical protein ANN_02905 [Periplaneta americana]|uniref:HAT C-terminal dimerisation domain-containing protein n=1 Tax=Periplaneta americana TaxID=6978 RepID=A0ABQ8U014_PERAM|nr:hypothetical protein ANN_02905 [Periplaneta americana]
MFATTYVCEKLFSTMKIVKTKFRSGLTDKYLRDQLRLTVRFPPLQSIKPEVKDGEGPCKTIGVMVRMEVRVQVSQHKEQPAFSLELSLSDILGKWTKLFLDIFEPRAVLRRGLADIGLFSPSKSARAPTSYHCRHRVHPYRYVGTCGMSGNIALMSAA